MGKKALTTAQRRRLRSALSKGKSARGTAKKLGCARSTVRYWKQRKCVKMVTQREKRRFLIAKIRKYSVKKSSGVVAKLINCSPRVVRDIRQQLGLDVREDRQIRRRKEALEVWESLERIWPE